MVFKNKSKSASKPAPRKSVLMNGKDALLKYFELSNTRVFTSKENTAALGYLLTGKRTALLIDDHTTDFHAQLQTFRNKNTALIICIELHEQFKSTKISTDDFIILQAYRQQLHPRWTQIQQSWKATTTTT